MTTLRPPATSRFIQWMTAGVISGIAVGLVIGIILAGGIRENVEHDSFSKASIAATSLGWISLDEHAETSQSVLRIHELASLSSNLEDALKGKYNDVISYKDISQSRQHETPTIETESASMTKLKQSPITSSNGYTDGTGDIEIHSATLEQIDEIPYVRISAAESIYQYLQEHTITNFDQLLEIKGVGEKTVQRLREHFHIK